MRDNSTLFVAGDEEVQQHVYDTYEFGYWSAGFDAILEKNGFLDFETATQDVLADPETLRQYDVVLVAWLPPTFWEMAYLRALWEYDGLIFLEGPFPGFLEDLLGVEATEDRQFEEGSLVIKDDDIHSHITESFENVLNGAEKVPLRSKHLETKSVNQSKNTYWDKRDESNEDFEALAEKVAESFTFAYEKRIEAENLFPDDRPTFRSRGFFPSSKKRVGPSATNSSSRYSNRSIQKRPRRGSKYSWNVSRKWTSNDSLTGVS